MKKALEKLRRAFPAAEDKPFEGMGHGDIIGHPEIMAAEINKFIERSVGRPALNPCTPGRLKSRKGTSSKTAAR